MYHLLNAAGAAAIVLSTLFGFAQAHEVKLDSLTLIHPWVRLNIADRPAAGYMAIVNDGSEGDRLIAASSPWADRIELHNHVMQEGAMQMIKLEVVAVPAGETVVFEPGGLHLMVFGLHDGVAAGDRIPLTLIFERAGALEVLAEALPLGGGGQPGHDDGHNHGHGQ